jgi:hypothetical protein
MFVENLLSSIYEEFFKPGGTSEDTKIIKIFGGLKNLNMK